MIGGKTFDGDVALLLETDETRPSPESLVGLFRHFSGNPKAGDPESAAFWRAFSSAMRGAQVFDYGEISEPQFRKEAMGGADLLSEGLLRPPYEAVVCHYTLSEMPPAKDAENKISFAEFDKARYLTAIAGPVAMPMGGEAMLHYFVTDFIRIPVEAAARMNTPRHYHDTRLWFCAGAGVVHCFPGAYWTGRLEHNPVEHQSPQDAHRLLGSLADGVSALSMILCTKGIRLRPEEPSEKLNKKRVKQGKPPLTLVTHVDARGYFEAAARTDRGGTHASPIPHLRRGHIRHYRNGRKKLIKPMFINCRSMAEIRPRDHYEVKTLPVKES